MNERIIKYSQNLLTSQKHIQQILSNVKLNKEDVIFEIGSGKGHFTLELAKRCKYVTAIEIDPYMCRKTKERTTNLQNVHIVNKDVLEFKFPKHKQYKIFGNIPYYISTDIIKKIVFASTAEESYLIVAYGFAKRLLNTNRALALLIMPEMEIKILRKIPKTYFHPKPKINSVLIVLKRRKPLIPYTEKSLYRKFVMRWVRRDYRSLFTKNQLRRALQYAKISDLNNITFTQFISLYESYKLFRNY